MLEPVAEDVVFQASGSVNGLSFDMNENTIMLTEAGTQGPVQLYQGTLFSGCETALMNTCGQSFSITFFDSTNSNYNNQGYPVILEPGVKSVYMGESISITPEFCINTTGTDSVHIDNGVTIDENHPYCFEPQAVFPEFEAFNLNSASNQPDSLSLVFHMQDVMVSRMGDEVIYYYFKLNCLGMVDSCMLMSISLEGNSPYTIDDFILFDNYNQIELNAQFKVSVFNPFGPLDLFFTAFQLNSNQTSNFGLFYYGSPTGIMPNLCDWPISFSLENSITTTSGGIVSITYVDEFENVFTSIGNGSLDNGFIINSAEPYLIDGSGNATVLSSITYNGTLANQLGQVLEFSDVELTFAFGHLPQ